MNEEQIKDIVKQYLKDNLTIETKESNDFGDRSIYVAICLDGKEITYDTINLSNE